MKKLHVIFVACPTHYEFKVFAYKIENKTRSIF